MGADLDKAGPLSIKRLQNGILAGSAGSCG